MKWQGTPSKSNTSSFARAQVTVRSWPVLVDLCVAGALLAGFYLLIWLGRTWMHPAVPEVTIYRSPSHLPLYALESTVRIFIAYLLSLIFAVVYGYIAAYNRWLEGLMIATLDILQSIPVLSFLPGVMLAMMSLFPSRQIGIEMGAILLIFTGEVWNMAFSFYSSLKNIPQELKEACAINRFSRWQRLFQLELPFSAIGLIWNSMVSVANGWFFLMVCEMFPVGSRNYRLPGLGSYIQTAASNGDVVAITWGLLTMVLIIVLTDQLLWRPILAWSEKFKFESVESTERITSPILHLIRNSNLLQYLSHRAFTPLSERFYQRVAHGEQKQRLLPAAEAKQPARRSLWVTYTLLTLLVAGCVTSLTLHAVTLLHGTSLHEILTLLYAALMTFLRVNASLIIASLWTIPVGVAIGFHPRLASITQPIAQVVASFPATALFPLIVIGLMEMGMGLGVGSVILMLIGAQWYILFNVIAGAMAIPSDLREVAGLFRFGSLQRWKTLILPGIFPYLITGLITASGGAWNASIVAEYFKLKGKTLQTVGLGAQISAASDQGDFSRLLLATIIMALMVVTINRLVWRRLYHMGETRYRLDA